MKKFTYSLFLFAVTALILSSCSTQWTTASITKRHYRNGYYVDMGNAKHKTETVSQKTITPAEIVPATQITAEKNLSEPAPVKAITATATDKKNKQTAPKEITASAIKHSGSSNLNQTPAPNTLKELKNMKAISKLIASENKSHHSDNNSLIWTIVVILLILWVISYFTGGWGLGGLIYLFLVIALFLIILKLLGII